ncbi:MAG: dimethylamine corrinoid protein 3 [Firmicutes bacterium HGW-Firmicutes-11]|jgi:trimethylamine corrinoid protein|nr:MAG: dimethylamine corrinoid protein 3 [Firmicutes bacterium HGW-Firmicutes-11]
MSKEAILLAAKESIIECDEDKALEAFEQAQTEGLSMVELLSDGFSAGMRELGDQFGMGEIFLPELIFSTEVMKMITEKIEATLETTDAPKKGVLVIGTVAGDVHDIGKGIVASLVKTNGIEVHDLGREVPAEVFIEKAKEFNADFIGSSALLTTTMTEQKKIEELLVKEGMRDRVKTMVGGAPVTKRWAEKIGADAYCEDATDAVNVILGWLEK